MFRSEFDALIFDSDGVLVDSEAIHLAVERELLAELGLFYDTETYLSRFVGLSNADFFSQLKADYALQSRVEFPPDFVDQLQNRVWPRIEAELQPIEGIAQLVETFAGKVAVGSSATKDRLLRKLTITDLMPLFASHIYSVDDVERGKPEPDLFLHVAHQLGVQPQRCAVIEDSVNGIRAARAAEMTAIGFIGGSHADSGLRKRLLDAGASIVASSHWEIGAHFK
jgi:HAD superfamily hydrolase (TIGR01509 family)